MKQPDHSNLPLGNLYPDPPLPDVWLNVPGHICVTERLRLLELAQSVPDGGAILEVGVWLGGSLACLLAGARDRNIKVYSVDLYPPKMLDRLMKYFAAYNVATENLVVEKGDSRDIGLRWKKPLDLVFLDGSKKDRETPRADLDNFGKCVVPGGYLAIHDSRYPDEREFSDRVHRLYGARYFADLLAPVLEAWFAEGGWTELEPTHTIRVFRRKT